MLKLVNLEIVDQLCQFFGITPGDLFERVEQK